MTTLKALNAGLALTLCLAAAPVGAAEQGQIEGVWTATVCRTSLTINIAEGAARVTLRPDKGGTPAREHFVPANLSGGEIKLLVPPGALVTLDPKTGRGSVQALGQGCNKARLQFQKKPG